MKLTRRQLRKLILETTPPGPPGGNPEYVLDDWGPGRWSDRERERIDNFVDTTIDFDQLFHEAILNVRVPIDFSDGVSIVANREANEIAMLPENIRLDSMSVYLRAYMRIERELERMYREYSG